MGDDGKWIYDDGPVAYWFHEKKKCTCNFPIVGNWDHKAKVGRCMCGGKITEADLYFRRRVKR